MGITAAHAKRIGVVLMVCVAAIVVIVALVLAANREDWHKLELKRRGFTDVAFASDAGPFGEFFYYGSVGNCVVKLHYVAQSNRWSGRLNDILLTEPTADSIRVDQRFSRCANDSHYYN